MSQKRNKIIVLIGAIIIVGILIFVYAHKSHIIILNSLAFSDNFKGYGTVHVGDYLTIKIPLQLISSHFSLRDKDILCFNSNLASPSFKVISKEQKVENIQNSCIRYDSNNTNIEIEIKGKVANNASNVLNKRRIDRVTLLVYKKIANNNLAQTFKNLSFTNNTGEKQYFKDIASKTLGYNIDTDLQQGLVPSILQLITVFSVK
jgi:hypothetical protein